MPSFDRLSLAADLDGLVVTHLPNVFYLTNFLGTAGIAVVDARSAVLDSRFPVRVGREGSLGHARTGVRTRDRSGRADLRRNARGAHQEAAAEASRHRGEPCAGESRESAGAQHRRVAMSEHRPDRMSIVGAAAHRQGRARDRDAAARRATAVAGGGRHHQRREAGNEGAGVRREDRLAHQVGRLRAVLVRDDRRQRAQFGPSARPCRASGC